MQIDDKIHLINIGPIAIWGDIFCAAYAIVGDKVTLIDSGLPTSWEQFIAPYLRKIGRDPKEVSLVVCTHNHIDHVGSNEMIKRACNAEIAMHDLGAEESENPGFLREKYHKAYREYLTDEDEADIRKEPLPKKMTVERRLHDGERLDIEGLEFRVVYTPGHTDDSICLYNSSKGLLFTGDSVQGGGNYPIPPISELTSVDQYLASVNRLKYLRVKSMLAGHAYMPFDARCHLPVLTEDESQGLIRESIDRIDRERMHVLNSLGQYPLSIGEISRQLGMRIIGSEDHQDLVLLKTRAILRTLVDEGWVEAIGKRDGMMFARIR